MLVNFSNHASETWSAEQLEAAEDYGGVIDVAFPEVPPEADEAEISTLANKFFNMIMSQNPTAVLVQGEMTLAFAVAGRVIAAGLPAVCACSRRCCEIVVHEDGSVERRSLFRFVKFRKYEKGVTE